MAQMTPQKQVQELNQCIQDCQNAVSELQNLTKKANDTQLVSTLKESIHHLEMSIQECKYASQATP